MTVEMQHSNPVLRGGDAIAFIDQSGSIVGESIKGVGNMSFVLFGTLFLKVISMKERVSAIQQFSRISLIHKDLVKFGEREGVQKCL